jgi:D-alanine-D-alanine ligase-like ATP-grasp enzyme
MRVCVLYEEDPDEPFSPAEFLAQYPCEWEILSLRRPVRETIVQVARQNRFDVYFNLCDAPIAEDYAGIDVVQVLEELNLPFTGADSRFYDPTREEMQAAAEAIGIGFARGHRVTTTDELDSLTANLHYPLMVKHPQSFGSTGMTRESKVQDQDELRKQFERIRSEFGSARVEEFIEGEEYNVFVVDNPDDLSQPFVYPPAQLIFPPQEEFWHTDIKWDYSVPFDFKEVKDPGLAGRLQHDGIQFYQALGGTGYGRCDVRVKDDGTLHFLEINANPGILYRPEEYGPADYMILYDKDGYFGFFDRIFRSAIARQKMRASRLADGHRDAM